MNALSAPARNIASIALYERVLYQPVNKVIIRLVIASNTIVNLPTKTCLAGVVQPKLWIIHIPTKAISSSGIWEVYSSADFRMSDPGLPLLFFTPLYTAYNIVMYELGQ